MVDQAEDFEDQSTDLATVDGDGVVVMDGDEPESDIRRKALELKGQVENKNWDLAEVLFEIYRDAHYLKWGYKAWRDYVEQELDFRLRKAQYLVNIFDWFSRMSLDVQNWVKSLGWTKAKELVGRVTNENAAEWKRKLEGKSVREMLELIEQSERDDEDGDSSEGDEEKQKDPDEKEKPTKIGFSVFRHQRENVQAALERAKKVANTEKDGHAIDLICTEYLATNSDVEDLASYLKRIEKVYGINFVAYDAVENVVVFGGDLLDRLSDEDGSSPDSE